MTIIAAVLIYASMGMLTSVVLALILTVAGDEPSPADVVVAFIFWPLTLAILFAGALEGSE